MKISYQLVATEEKLPEAFKVMDTFNQMIIRYHNLI